MHRIVKSCYLDMAHRIRGHSGKCRFLHGHTWKIELSVVCADDQLDELGMVVDFSVLKGILKSIQEKFDHSTILNSEDKILPYSLPVNHQEELNVHVVDFEITAETLSKHIFELAALALGGREIRDREIHLDYVRVYEQLHPTESYAEYREMNYLAT